MYSLSTLLILVGAVLLRWCISLHTYSGQRIPPMYGDYEAQRHWMEVTRNLPISEWYSNTTDNDLSYWGLDYPPLTAYHSLVCGYVAEYINPKFVALNTSRGFESQEHKLFMRATVLLADLLLYMPAVWWFFTCKKLNDVDQTSHHICGFLALIYPGLILIDHGHFQYNNISLGLFVAAVAALTIGRNLLGAIFFCLAVNYKQMELYHALPFFCYLLGSCRPNSSLPIRQAFLKLVQIATTVVATFLVIWLPFLGNLNLTLQVLHRLFPLARGVFEDKVANVWCAINVVYKLRNSFTNESMARLCLLTTGIAILPTCLDLLSQPNVRKFNVSLINTSLAFFLFSFQVHEKSVLLVAIPVALHLGDDPFVCFWFLIVSTFSMLPLLIKDGLLIPTLALTIFYVVTFSLTTNRNGSQHKNSKQSSLLQNTKQPKKNHSPSVDLNTQYKNKFARSLFCISMTGCVILTVSSVSLKPPESYPDIYSLLVSVYSCLHFCLFFVYFNYKQIMSTGGESKQKLS